MKKIRTNLLCAFTLAISLCPNITQAAPPRLWPGHTQGTPITLTYSYNNILNGRLKKPDRTTLSPIYIKAAIEEALTIWTTVAPIHFIEVPDQGDIVPITNLNYPNGQYGTIRFSHRYINGPDDPNKPPTTKATAYSPAATKLAGDIHFDNSDPWQIIGSLHAPDILGAAIHEIGHTLGLPHTNNPDANMYWTFKRHTGLGSATLHQDDITNIQAIYGTTTGSLTTIPEPTTLLLLLPLFTKIASRPKY